MPLGVSFYSVVFGIQSPQEQKQKVPRFFIVKKQNAMKNNDLLKKLHVGSIVKEVADQKKIPSKQLVDTIGRYTENGDKIYKLDDMDGGDIVKISYLFGYNLLEDISEKYLSHIPIEDTKRPEILKFTMHPRTGRLTHHRNPTNCNFLKDIHIGEYLKQLAYKNHWSKSSLSHKLNCSLNSINYYFTQESMKIKKMIALSIALNHNLIAEVYLSRMSIVPLVDHFNDCILTMTEQEILISKPHDDSFPWSYKRQKNGD